MRTSGRALISVFYACNWPKRPCCGVHRRPKSPFYQPFPARRAPWPPTGLFSALFRLRQAEADTGRVSGTPTALTLDLCKQPRQFPPRRHAVHSECAGPGCGGRRVMPGRARADAGGAVLGWRPGARRLAPGVRPRAPRSACLLACVVFACMHAKQADRRQRKQQAGGTKE